MKGLRGMRSARIKEEGDIIAYESSPNAYISSRDDRRPIMSILNDPHATALFNNHPNALRPPSTDLSWLHLIRHHNAYMRTHIHIRSSHTSLSITHPHPFPQLIHSPFHHFKACPQKRPMKYPVWLLTSSTSFKSTKYILPSSES